MHAKTIKTCSLPYGWQEMVKFVRKSPQRIQFGGGTETKHALDSQLQIILDNRAIEDALKHIVHPSDPFCSDSNGKVSENKIMKYIEEYTKEFDAREFSYTYYQELTKGFIDRKVNEYVYFDQIHNLKEGLKKQINENLSSNRNIAVLYNPLKWNMNSSSPCWNTLWIRFERKDQDETIWVSICTFYRSHDLTDAWESNFIAQVTFIQKEILDPLNAKILYWHESNASLHIYEHNLPTAMKIKEISVSPQLRSLQEKYNKE